MNTATHPPNCDGSGPHIGPQVRSLPSADSNLHLCRSCYLREMIFRRGRNRDLSDDTAYKTPAWESLEIIAGPVGGRS